jgi:uncharacterized protein
MTNLSIGINPNFDTRPYTLNDNKLGIKIVFLSDLHFNRKSKTIADKLIASITALNPDIILLGGDYVDTNEGLNLFATFIKQLASITACKAILGNHDNYFYKKALLDLFSKNNIEVLDKNESYVACKHRKILISNCNHDHNTTADLSILLLHKPISPNKVLAHFQLILAGHLHGCQIVWWQKNKYLYPGAWFYKNNFIEQDLHFSKYLISKGLGDTIGLRYKCNKDIIFVEV